MGNKIGIIYFSGTGNTKFVAQNIAKKLQQWGEELDLINIEKDKIIPTHYKYLIIGGPIYIDRYPEILIKYAKDNLKNYKNKCIQLSKLILSLLIRISIVIILLFIGEIKGYLIIFFKIFLKNESTYRFSCIYFKKNAFFP